MKKLTIEDFHRIGLEVQSHTGLSYLNSDYYIYIFLCMQKLCTFKEDFDITDTIVNHMMQYYHDNKRKSINKNIKSYDWC